jgi:hypothetical protein
MSISPRQPSVNAARYNGVPHGAARNRQGQAKARYFPKLKGTYREKAVNIKGLAKR